jgi:hypothetical protein
VLASQKDLLVRKKSGESRFGCCSHRKCSENIECPHHFNIQPRPCRFASMHLGTLTRERHHEFRTVLYYPTSSICMHPTFQIVNNNNSTGKTNPFYPSNNTWTLPDLRSACWQQQTCA